MNIAILCGSHQVAWSFTRHMMEQHSFHIAFIESDRPNNVLNQVSINQQVRMLQYEDEDKTVRTIQEFGVDTVVLAWWPKIVHKINKLGINVINTHPSYLPYNRGKHPYYWALVDGTPFGATIHRVDNGIDTGEILWQKTVQLDPTDTGETAYKKAADAMLQLLIEHAEDIAIGRFPPGIQQDRNIANHHFARELDVPPITSKMESALINDLRARTFNNKQSGRKIVIDGVTYRIHLNLVQE